MELSGAIFTVLGLMISLWAINGQRKSIGDRPFWFARRNSLILINLIWIAFIIVGIYFFWHISAAIAIPVFSGLVVIWAICLQKNYRAKAIKYFHIYKELLANQPNASERDLWVQSVRSYLESIQVENIDGLINSIFKEDGPFRKLDDITSVAMSAILVERYAYHHSGNKLMRIEKNVLSAYKEVFPNGPRRIGKNDP